jgi:hypothetical protein
MRKFIIRALILALLPIGIAAAPAKADKLHIPWGCELMENTGCHCISPSGVIYCLGIAP